MVLNENGSNSEAFSLVAVYAPRGTGQPDKFRRLDVFLGTFLPLVLVGDFNSILNT